MNDEMWDECYCVQDESRDWWRCPEHGQAHASEKISDFVESLADSAQAAGISTEVFKKALSSLTGPSDHILEVIAAREWRDIRGDLFMWIHDLAPEHCACKQCEWMREDIKRIERLHAGEA